MVKLTFTAEEITLLRSLVDIDNKSKQTVLNEFKRKFDWNYEVKQDWFDDEDEYNNAIQLANRRRTLAKNIVSHLNQMSDKEWALF